MLGELPAAPATCAAAGQPLVRPETDDRRRQQSAYTEDDVSGHPTRLSTSTGRRIPHLPRHSPPQRVAAGSTAPPGTTNSGPQIRTAAMPAVSPGNSRRFATRQRGPGAIAAWVRERPGMFAEGAVHD